jgi:hypothetical protein
MAVASKHKIIKIELVIGLIFYSPDAPLVAIVRFGARKLPTDQVGQNSLHAHHRFSAPSHPWAKAPGTQARRRLPRSRPPLLTLSLGKSGALAIKPSLPPKSWPCLQLFRNIPASCPASSPTFWPKEILRTLGFSMPSLGVCGVGRVSHDPWA